jgi:hypothetical protein
LLDSIALEQRGIPTACICTHLFEPTIKAIAKLHGIPDYPYALVEHPIGRAREAELQAKARQVADRVYELLAAGARA